MKRLHSRKKNSTKVFAIAALVAALLFVISSYFIGSEKGTVVARVNNEKIFKSEIDAKLRSVFEGQNFGNKDEEVKIPDIASLPKEVIEILAKEIYLDRELTKQATKSKAAKEKVLQEKIAESKNRMLRQAYINSLMKDKVSEEKVKEKYTELSNGLVGKKEYSVAHIVTKSKEEAEKLEKELNSKKAPKFAEVAKKYSIDQESAARGGELGYVLEDNMIKEISDVIAKLKKGQISAPVQSKFGWHLIKVLEVRDAQALPFESVKENIREQLSQDALNEINTAITKDAKVKIVIKLQEPKAPEAAPAAEAQPAANSVAAPEAVEEVVAEEEKVEEKAEEKTEEKSAKTEKNEAKKHKDSKSKKSKK
jgi:peptidyl-prolyl cis-trans isomerase C